MPDFRIPTGVRALLFLSISVLLVFSSAGCHLTRSERSRYIAPPVDIEARAAREKIQEMLDNPEIYIPQGGEYYIGPGDVLAITLVGRPEVFGATDEGNGRLIVQVTENPLIALPLIGAIKVHGKTAEQLRAELETAYSKFIVNPIPIVTIEEFHQNQISVLGTVSAPGRYPLDFGDTLLDAIFKAGGLSVGRGNAPARYLKIYREKLNQKERSDLPLEELLARITEDDRILPRTEIIIPIDRLIQSGDLDYNIPLQQNDIVYIPSAGTVMVEGKVSQPGVVFMGPSLRTVTHVITASGGLQFSAASTIEVVRTLENGEQVSYFLDSRKMLKRKTEDFLLQDGDQIFVYTHPVRAAFGWLGNFFSATARTGVNATYNPL